MNERCKSGGSVVPGKLPNKAAHAVAEGVEGRDLAKGSLPEQNAMVEVLNAI
ncbi:MAG: hypothetical protein IT509_08175 [Rhodocyclaceae bacterium]|nr:hypothetical protein [Rhodocyclaceae bacterium]